MKKIIIYITIIIICSFLTSCEEIRNKELANKLQGDWIYNYSENQFFISIRDSLYLGDFEHYDEFVPYYIRKDTLIVPSRSIKYKLSRVTNKYIWMKEKRTGQIIPRFRHTNIYHDTTLTLKSLEIRFINFWSRGITDWAVYFDGSKDCFVKIEKVIKNKGIEHPLAYSKGLYYRKLTDDEFNFFQSKFRNVPLSQIKKEYLSRNFYLGRSCSLNDNKIVICECKFAVEKFDETKTISFIAKGYDRLPSFLKVFIIHLNKMHSFMQFAETNKRHDFKFYQTYSYPNDFLNLDPPTKPPGH